jgi:hypothetical protein
MLRGLLVYDQAHGGLRRVFNNLAISYDQAHGSYDQAHGAIFDLMTVNCSIEITYALRVFAVERVYGMVLWFMVMV